MATHDDTLPADDVTVGDSRGPATLEPASEAPAELAAGAVVSRYVVVGTLGRGGMGEVYAAYDPKLERRVALKIFRRRKRGSDDAQLLAEAQAMARINHPNVVAVHDVGEHEGSVFLAMELVAGSTLRTWLGAERRSVTDILRVFVAAGRGLAAAHDSGLVHRDFKPDNVLVQDDGRALVSDFGLAMPRTSNEASSSLQGDSDSVSRIRFAGTPAYSAPEQHGDGPVGAAADQFAFCVALFEALYGQRPFEGDTVVELASNITRGRMRTLPPDPRVPPWLRRAVLTGLAVRPADRHPSMEALLELLDRDPTRRRRVMLAAVGVVVVSGGTWTAREMMSSAHRAACKTEARGIAEVWNPARAEALRETMLGTELPFAKGSYERVAAHLDEYADAWSEQRNQACLAPSDQRVPEADLCFDTLAEDVGFFLDGMQASAADSLRQSVTAVYSLPAPSSCRDRGWLRLNPPRSPESGTEVNELRQHLAQARMTLAMGDQRGAAAAARSVAEQAAALNLPQLQAAALLVAASGLNIDAQHQEAQELAEEGFFIAARSSADITAAKLATELAYSLGYGQRRTVEGEHWVRLALLWQQRYELPDNVLALALDRRGLLTQAAGDPKQAAVEFRRSLELGREHFGDEHPSLVGAMSRLAEALAEARELGAARQTALEAIELARKVFGPEHPVVGNLDETMGNIELLSGNTAAAVEHYLVALEHRRRNLGPNHPAVASVLSNLGVAYVHLHDNLAAAEYDVQAAAIAATLEGWEGRRFRLLTSAAMGFASAGEAERSRQQHDAALALLPELSPSLELAQGLGLLGQLAAFNGELEAAHQRCERALAMLAELGQQSGRTTLALRGHLVTLFLARGDPERALAAARASVEHARELDGPDSLNVMLARLQVTEALIAGGSWDEARAVLGKIDRLLPSPEGEHELERYTVSLEARIELHDGNLPHARAGRARDAAVRAGQRDVSARRGLRPGADRVGRG